MSVCTREFAKAVGHQEGVPINCNETTKEPLKPGDTCISVAFSPHSELNQDLPENLDDLAILYGRYFGE